MEAVVSLTKVEAEYILDLMDEEEWWWKDEEKGRALYRKLKEAIEKP